MQLRFCNVVAIKTGGLQLFKQPSAIGNPREPNENIPPVGFEPTLELA